MNILIFGATGGTGRQIVQQGLEQGHQVSAFVRNPGKFDITHENLNIIQGDVLNPDDCAKAVAGQDAVLSGLGVKPGNKPICAEGIGNIIDAMKKNDVSRLIVCSAYGTRDDGKGFYSWLLNLLLKAVMADKNEMEILIEKSGLDWVIVLPPILTNGDRTSSYVVGMEQPSGLFPKISRADVAEFMLQCLEDDSWLEKRPVAAY